MRIMVKLHPGKVPALENERSSEWRNYERDHNPCVRNWMRRVTGEGARAEGDPEIEAAGIRGGVEGVAEGVRSRGVSLIVLMRTRS